MFLATVKVVGSQPTSSVRVFVTDPSFWQKLGCLVMLFQLSSGPLAATALGLLFYISKCSGQEEAKFQETLSSRLGLSFSIFISLVASCISAYHTDRTYHRARSGKQPNWLQHFSILFSAVSLSLGISVAIRVKEKDIRRSKAEFCLQVLSGIPIKNESVSLLLMVSSFLISVSILWVGTWAFPAIRRCLRRKSDVHDGTIRVYDIAILFGASLFAIGGFYSFYELGQSQFGKVNFKVHDGATGSDPLYSGFGILSSVFLLSVVSEFLQAMLVYASTFAD